MDQRLASAVLVQPSVLSQRHLCLINMDCVSDSFAYKSCSDMFAVCKGSIYSPDICSIDIAEGLVCINLLKDLSRVPILRFHAAICIKIINYKFVRVRSIMLPLIYN